MNFKVQNVKIDTVKIWNDCLDQFPASKGPIFISKEPPLLDTIKEQINTPEELDSLTQDLNIPSRLINYHLATPADLSVLKLNGLNKTIHLPVQISTREGGRKSLYKLKKGEEVLAGIFVNSNGIILRKVSKISGDSRFAKTGDGYKTTLLDSQNNIIFEGTGELEIIDKKVGHGKIKFIQTDTPQVSLIKGGDKIQYVNVWVIFSGIYITGIGEE